MTTATLLDEALDYLARGWPVVPVTGKRPAIPWGEYQSRPPSRDEFETWDWSRATGLAIIIGPALWQAEPGLWVLDVEAEHRQEAEAWLDSEMPHWRTGLVVATGGGGWHVYCVAPGPVTTSPCTWGEVRGGGSICVLPPSVHPDTGARYTWHSDGEPVRLDPDWVPGYRGSFGPNGHVGGDSGPIPEGQRNDTLFRIAGRLRGDGHGYEAIVAHLRRINAERCRPPLPDAEVVKIAGSAARYEPNPKLIVPGHAPQRFHCTDLGNAERLVAAYGDDLRYCYPWGRWLVWDGQRWRVDESGSVEAMAKTVARRILHEAAEAEAPEWRKSLVAWAAQSETKHRIEAMIVLARSEPGIPVLPSQLDADPWLLNCQNGTLDLRTGELRPHRREDLLTKLAGAPYDPAATAPVFEAFLRRILPDPEVRRYVQKLAGYSLTGEVREHRLPVFHGTGRNGKSTLVGIWLYVLGDYGRQAAPEILVLKSHDEHPTALADLFGARFVATIEVGEGRRLAEALVKSLTGGDKMKARYMHRDFFEWDPTHKIVLVCNHLPLIRGTDEGIWSRIDLVPFTVVIPEEERDEALPTKLRDEAAGILAWMVDGCRLWQAEGLGRPPAVVAATAAYRSEQDALAEFLADCCVIQPPARVETTVLIRAYVDWCERNHEQPLSRKALGLRLAERGIEQAKSHGKRYYVGIGLLGEPAQQTMEA